MLRVVSRKLVAVRSLVPVLFVAIGVALAFTVAAAAFERFHQVSADDVRIPAVEAVADGNGSQVLTIGSWNVQLVLPLGEDMPLVNYAGKGSDSVGLSSAALSGLDAKCSAQANALGSILRLSAGSFAHYPSGGQAKVFLANVGGSDFVYQMPLGTCTGGEVASGLVAQAEAAIQGVGVIRPINR